MSRMKLLMMSLCLVDRRSKRRKLVVFVKKIVGIVRMRPVFCGSFDYETRQSDLERLFSKYGTVDRVDMKSGFAFVYFDDERVAEDAIRSLDNTPFGYTKRRLSVEWSRGERGNRRDGSRIEQSLETTCVLSSSQQHMVPPPGDLKGSLTTIDERTGKKYQVQVSEDGKFVSIRELVHFFISSRSSSSSFSFSFFFFFILPTKSPNLRCHYALQKVLETRQAQSQQDLSGRV